LSLTQGARLGPYEVLSRLGAGGMGEVWRARDTRLQRDVAIKVLPGELSSDAGRLKRFEKEARSASALNHPNIVTIYDIGQSDSVAYIAMELVDGKTLRELLYAGPLPIKRVLAITAQVADGLARAHEAGIVHRDLKPENVMVTKDGRVKILDFGLAKLTHTGVNSGEGTNSPTETGTGAGVVLGTVGYMSPEQASGQPVDFRSDQFSFGSILYELVTGKRAFQKKTGVETLSAIIQAEPEPIGTLNAEAPAPLRWMVERCLAKDPVERYGTTQDLARDLATLRDHLTESIGVRAIEPPRRPWRALGALAAVVILSAGIFVGRRLLKEPLPLAPTFQPLTFRRGSISSAKFTADGNTIVYSASWGGEPQQLFATRPENPESQTLPFPGAEVAAISSRGEMALLKDGILSRAPLSGGAAREVLADVGGADWSPDGSQLAVIHNVSGRPRIEYPIGKVLYEGQQGGAMWYVRVSPKGDRIAFDDCPQPYGDGLQYIAVVDLQGRKTTLTTGWFGIDGVVWSPVGDEIWFVGGQEARRHGELHAISPEGKERIVLRAPGSFMFSDLTRDGRGLLILAFCRTSIAGMIPGESAERDFSWFDGSAVEDLSPDGRTLLFTEGGVGGEADNAVYVRKLDGSPPVRIGENAGSGGWCLSPDGRWAIARVLATPPKLTLIPTGTGETRTLERGSIEQYWWGAGWFPDGKRIWFNGREPGRDIRAYVQNIDGGPPRPLLPEGIRGRLVSPDGKLMAAVDRGGPKKIVFFSAEGQPIALHHDLPADSEPSVFSADSRFLFTFGYGQMPVPVYRLDLATGKKQLWKELAPPDRTGLESGAGPLRLTPDGRSYVYTYSRCQHDLYLVEGLK
jgi:eukaryotic-like serine/threonine-protein kinase